MPPVVKVPECLTMATFYFRAFQSGVRENCSPGGGAWGEGEGLEIYIESKKINPSPHKFICSSPRI